jgi:hypothetical protein
MNRKSSRTVSGREETIDLIWIQPERFRTPSVKVSRPAPYSCIIVASCIGNDLGDGFDEIRPAGS